jgi:hypothetical protein
VPTRGGPTIHPCKTKGSHRTVRLDAETAATIERHREAQQVERALAGEPYADRDLIFADELGGPIRPSHSPPRSVGFGGRRVSGRAGCTTFGTVTRRTS